jgi:HEPN domain-containing protein
VRRLDDPEVVRWLDRALADRLTAETLLATGDPVFAGVICFHCQQEAEKLLKATLVRIELAPPKTHDLLALVDLLVPHLAEVVSLREDAATLFPWAVIPRYPGPANPTLDGVGRPRGRQRVLVPGAGAF